MALFNRCFAKAHGGQFILRIEDTDQARSTAAAEQMIFDSLKWLGLDWDEGPDVGGDHGPYRQSERRDIYGKYAWQLVEQGNAFVCYRTPEELEILREARRADGRSTALKPADLELSEGEQASRKAAGASFVIRMRVPDEQGACLIHDRLRGDIELDWSMVDAQILLKSDGMPTYHLANIVDDHLMGITHVIRGEEWLPSAPLHVMLYEAFGWERPAFAHLPLLLKPDGPGKLSKRDGDRLGFPVFPIDWNNPDTGETASGYREFGFFPGSFINMLALLGWNPGTEQEVFDLQGLIDAFDLSKVSKSGAKFDFEKGKWFNQLYLRALSEDELASELKNELDKEGLSYNEAHLGKIATMMSERATFPQDLLTEGRFLFEVPSEYDEKTRNKKWKDDSAGMMQDLAARFDALADFTEANIEAAFKGYLAEKELGFGKVGPSFRLAVTGKGMGPSMFTICEVLGKQEVLSRIAKAIEVLG